MKEKSAQKESKIAKFPKKSNKKGNHTNQNTFFRTF